ncbi:hypothetical protein B0J11DRAFT_442179 [Dendryphion nanum]|uniref:DH domain-containing protein n=1 Tax=Dendryphion nanum TaxID=256645 RepID=A0A9P9IF33_9PLEO|nr:hypothetical protein B0J11DRAFT_442179 [Dendryphion nanum]
MVLVTRFFWSHHKMPKDVEDSNSTGDNTTDNQYSIDPSQKKKNIFAIERPWKQLFAPKQNKGQWVPTLSGIIKAGDEGVYNSALFNALQANPGDINLEILFDVFRTELKTRSMTEKSSQTTEFSKFVTGPKHRRSQSVKINRAITSELPPRLQRASIDLAERGLTRSRSKRVSPVLLSSFNAVPSVVDGKKSGQHSSWTQDMHHAQQMGGKTAITVTPSELAALSIVIGSPLEVTASFQQSDDSSTVQLSASKGAFGISVRGPLLEDGKYYITLRQHKRSISQLSSRGSGYSSLFAKHMAAGSLPFSQDSTTTNSIRITSSNLTHIQAGTPLHLQRTSSPRKSSDFLSSLPNSKPPSFHTLLPSTTSSTSTPLLVHAIAALPFTGGLPPLASTPLIQTIKFIACGGLPPARLLQRLEALVDKIHRHSPNQHLFGPLFEPSNAGLLFRERERLGKLATSTNTTDFIADKVARMHRYTTMLERLMALVPDIPPQDVICKVREAAKKEFERSYVEAVAAFKYPQQFEPVRQPSGLSGRTVRSKRSSTSSMVPRSPTSPASLTSPRSSFTFPRQNLGRQVETILKSELPFSVEMIAQVARFVVVAWSISVEGVAWEEGEEGIRLGLGEQLPEKMVLC